MAIEVLDEAAIFNTARRITDSSARKLYVHATCGEDLALRARIEGLLQVYEEEPDFLASAPLDGQSSDGGGVSEAVGSQIGPYKLLEQIGEGGFGIVFVAEQRQPIRRTVALKIIKPGMDTRQVIARFEAERQALALMDHLHIARILDGGQTASGRPYFVMELVNGEPITAYCDQNHLPPRERLRLFVAVCAAVQHAHQKGIIHRDLKPTNILVAAYDGSPVVKVIDFGVAKALGEQLTERTLVTGVGSIIGTLEYMSPEQAEFNAKDVDTRADIYSLGVLLYELLTGTTPLTRERLGQTDVTEALRLIREEQPPKPSTRLGGSKETLASISAQRRLEPAKLTSELRGDLDWIVMKALEKDRDRRYATSGDLAEDVERYVRGEGIIARPPSAAYRLQVFARRNRRAMLSFTAVMLALLFGTGLAVWQAIDATQAKNAALKAVAAETLAKELALQAAAAESAAKDAALKAAAAETQANQRARYKEAESQAVLDFVKERILTAARPKTQSGGLGHDVSLRAAIEAAAPFVKESFKNQPLTEGRLHVTLGDAFHHSQDASAAVAQYELAVSIYTKYRGADHRDTLICLDRLADSYRLQGRLQEAVDLGERLLSTCRVKLEPADPVTLGVMQSLGSGYYQLGQYSQALDMHAEVLKKRQATVGPNDRGTLRSMLSLANDYMNLGRYDEALQLRLETLDLQKANLGPEDPDTLNTISNLGASYREMKQYAEALRLDEETLRVRRKLLGNDHSDTITSMWCLSSDLMQLDRGAEAMPLLAECLELAAGKHIWPDFHRVAQLRLNYFQKAGDAAGCLATAELWEKQKRADPGSMYQAARCRAVTAALFRAATTADDDQTQAAQEQADRAMDWLQQATAAGYKNIAGLKKDPNLNSLREREDFQKLLMEIEAAEGKPGK